MANVFPRGFSLLELIVTILVAAIVLVLGVPTFASALAKGRQTAELNALFHAFYLARKESVRRRRLVSLCPSADDAVCDKDANWNNGWLLFENTDQDDPPDRDPGEPLIMVHKTAARTKISANRRGFTSRGIRRRATNGTLVVCDARGRIPAKALVVSYTGRPRITAIRRNGDPYSCVD